MSTTAVKVTNPATPHVSVASAPPDLARTLQSVFDPFGVFASIFQSQQAWAQHPQEWLHALDRLAREMGALEVHGLRRALNLEQEDYIKPAEGDARFDAGEWHDDLAYDLLKQWYLLYTRWIGEAVYDTPAMTKHNRRRAAFWVRQWFNALAPTNYFLTNPVAIRKFFDTNGQSVLDGIANWSEDARAGDLQMVDSKSFSVGHNLATTPGAVVFRNELIELIHYVPMSEEVHAVPLVFATPWINKFYILDLNEKKSMVRHLLKQGFSVFVISWRNPDASMADTTFEDYVFKGVLAAVEAARALCGVPQVHAIGYCLGGTTLATLMAWLNREYEGRPGNPVASWTMLASLVDFSRAGEIETFLNEEGIRKVEEVLARKGYLDGREMSMTFRMLRPNSLIWHYFVHSYLYGEKPPAMDVLYWNTDTTRLPRAMHSFYLRNCYVKNALAQRDGITIGGHPIDLRRIGQPLYAVGSEEDHITPWRGTFKTCTLVSGPARYALSTSGHILGIINPPVSPPKRACWVGDWNGETDGKEWLGRHQQVPGSWWEDWTRWLANHCGPRQAPPPMETKDYPALCPAPGTYVLEH
jgi:poly[(R)-3-hydroxyalkanoate] polymerase subunit PhaC